MTRGGQAQRLVMSAAVANCEHKPDVCNRCLEGASVTVPAVLRELAGLDKHPCAGDLERLADEIEGKS